MDDHLLSLVERVCWMIGNGASNEEVADAIRGSWFVRDREKCAVVDVLSAMATFAQQERVTFNAEAIIAQALHMSKAMN